GALIEHCIYLGGATIGVVGLPTNLLLRARSPSHNGAATASRRCAQLQDGVNAVTLAPYFLPGPGNQPRLQALLDKGERSRLVLLPGRRDLVWRKDEAAGAKPIRPQLDRE